jgi:phage tail-like protein
MPGELIEQFTSEPALQGSYFMLAIDGVPAGVFTGCSGLSLEINVAKQQQASKEGKRFEIKIPGRTKYGTLSMKRGATEDLKLQQWFDQVVNGKMQEATKTVGVTVMDSEFKPMAKFTLDGCWPSKLSVSDLNASNDEIMVEDISIVYNGLKWE